MRGWPSNLVMFQKILECKMTKGIWNNSIALVGYEDVFLGVYVVTMWIFRILGMFGRDAALIRILILSYK